MSVLRMLLSIKQNVQARLDCRTKKTRGCWHWTGPQNHGGYGNFQIKVAPYLYFITNAHVASWILANKRLPRKLHVLHSCDTRLCVRPDHLFLGTHAENMADKMQKGRHPKGSEFAHSKLTEKVVQKILKARARGTTQKELANHYHVTIQAISCIDRGLTWKHVPRPK